MRGRLATWARGVAEWLDPSPPPLVPAWLVAVAAAAAHKVDAMPHTGQFKRALVLAALIKQYPAHRRRDLALALELAVRERLP